MISPWSKTTLTAVWKVSRAAPGNFGCLATQSFHETKNITCGEGAPWLLMMPGSSKQAEILREKGTNRSRFFRGQVDKYTWVDLGSSYLPSDTWLLFYAPA